MARFLKIDVDARDWKRRIDHYRFKKVPHRRRQYVRSVMADMLMMTAEFNPIETGRSRASWVQSRSRLGYTEPAAWKLNQGLRLPSWFWRSQKDKRAEGRRKSRLVWRERRHQTELRATSLVEYVVFLEYGTEHMRPFRMVRLSFEILEEHFDIHEFKP